MDLKLKFTCTSMQRHHFAHCLFPRGFYFGSSLTSLVCASSQELWEWGLEGAGASLPILPTRKRFQEAQRAALHAGSWGRSFPLGLLPSTIGSLPALCANFPHYLVQGRLWGQLQGHWLHGATRGQDVLETPLGTEEGLWGPGPALPSLRLRLSNLHSHTPCRLLIPPNTPHEHPLGVLEPRKVAQPGEPAPRWPFARCPAGSETLDGRRGDGESCIRKKESALPGHLPCANNCARHPYVSQEPTASCMWVRSYDHPFYR